MHFTQWLFYLRQIWSPIYLGRSNFGNNGLQCQFKDQREINAVQIWKKEKKRATAKVIIHKSCLKQNIIDYGSKAKKNQLRDSSASCLNSCKPL